MANHQGSRDVGALAAAQGSRQCALTIELIVTQLSGLSRSAGPSGLTVLSAIYFQLKHVKLVDITLEWLQNHVPILLMRRNIVSTVKDLVTDLGRTKASSE